MKNPNILLILFIISNSYFALGQGFSKPDSKHKNTATETIFVHSNAESFVAGETLYYQFYCLNQHNKTYSNISKIGYVEIIDTNQKSCLKQKISLTNGVGSGDFFISPSLKTGPYKLVGYTNWSLNNPEKNVFQMDLFIINPFQEHIEKEFILTDNTKSTDTSITTQSQSNIPAPNSANGLAILETDKNTYTFREKVNLLLNTEESEPISGNFSISVRKTDNLPKMGAPSSLTYLASKTSNQQNISEVYYIPELRGELLAGKIIPKETNVAVNNVTIALSLPGNDFAFYIVKTKIDGSFTFILNEKHFAQNAVIQILDPKRTQYKLTVNNPPFFSAINPVLFAQKKVLHPQMKKTIEERLIANQIENGYYKIKKDSLSSSPKSLPFYHPFEKTYILDDYTRFATLKETIVEIIPGMYYTENKGKYAIHLRDYETQIGSLGETLVLVDGLLLQDLTELFEYDMHNVYKISFVNKSYVYGPKIFSGIVNFTTKKKMYETKATGDYILTTNLERPAPAKKYHWPNYALEKKERIPDYRHQLLWLPEIKHISNTPYDFYTSDVPGVYSITLEGFTNQGIPISVSKTFVVE